MRLVMVRVASVFQSGCSCDSLVGVPLTLVLHHYVPVSFDTERSGMTEGQRRAVSKSRWPAQDQA